MPRLKHDILALTCVALGGAASTAATLAVLDARSAPHEEPVRVMHVSSCATPPASAPGVTIRMRDGHRSAPRAVVAVSRGCVTSGDARVIRLRSGVDLDRDRARLERARARMERDLARMERDRRSMERESDEVRRELEREARRMRAEIERAVRLDATHELEQRERALRELQREMRKVERDVRERGGGR